MIWIDLKHIIHGGGTRCFGEMVIELIFKADSFNKARLRQVFPIEVFIVELYMATGNIPELTDEELEKQMHTPLFKVGKIE